MDADVCLCRCVVLRMMMCVVCVGAWSVRERERVRESQCRRLCLTRSPSTTSMFADTLAAFQRSLPPSSGGAAGSSGGATAGASARPAMPDSAISKIAASREQFGRHVTFYIPVLRLSAFRLPPLVTVAQEAAQKARASDVAVAARVAESVAVAAAGPTPEEKVVANGDWLVER